MPEKNYLFGEKSLHFYSYDDIFALYENGLSVDQIAHRLSRSLGLTVSACKRAVICAVYERVCPACAPPAAHNAFLFEEVESPQDAAAVFDAPAKPSPRSWAVGDLFIRRY